GQGKIFLNGKGAAAASQRILEYARDKFRAAHCRLAGDIGRADHHLASGWRNVACEDTEQCRFAGAVRTDDRDERSVLDLEIDPVQRPLLWMIVLAEYDLDALQRYPPRPSSGLRSIRPLRGGSL